MRSLPFARFALLSCLWGTAGSLACSSAPSDAGGSGANAGAGGISGGSGGATGGRHATGGAITDPTGGAPSTGGTPATGGGAGATPGTGGVSGAGGTPATGGALASGGAPGGSGGSGGFISDGGAPSTGGAGSSGGSSGDPCAGAAICDGFEGTMEPQWSVQADSTPAPLIDSTKGANGSTSSLKVTGTSQQSFLVAPVPDQVFYVRTYMNLSQGTGSISAHGWFIVGADNATSGTGAQMRLGASANHGHSEVDFNVYGGGCTGEKTQFSDGASDGAQGWTNTTTDVFNFSANVWYCVEAFFNGPGNEFQLWIDGEEKTGLHVTEATMCPSWSPNYTVVKIGGGANGNIGDIWYDDVVISTSRVGCN